MRSVWFGLRLKSNDEGSNLAAAFMGGGKSACAKQPTRKFSSRNSLGRDTLPWFRIARDNSPSFVLEFCYLFGGYSVLLLEFWFTGNSVLFWGVRYCG